MTTFPNSKGLIFDLDGTLTLTQGLHFQAYNAVLKELGINYTQEEDQRLYASQGSEHILPKVLRKNGHTPKPNFVQQLIQRKRVIYQDLLLNSSVKPVPGIYELLEIAQKHSKRLAIATGNRREPAITILKKAKLEAYFEYIASSEDADQPKPAPDTYHKALSKLGLNSNECIAFEDTINGVQSAKASNLYCVGMTTNETSHNLKKAGANETHPNYYSYIQHNNLT